MSSRTNKPCHVVFIIENESFPWDRRMRHLGTALQHAGYQVSVICPKDDDQDRKGYEVFQGIRVYRYPMILQATGKLGYFLEYPWAFFCATVLSLYIWLRHGFDILHSANPPDFYFFLAWPYQLLGKKYVFDEHDVSPELYLAKFGRKDLFYRVLAFLQRMSYRTADLVISTNQSYHDLAKERGNLPESRQVIVRNGVDTAYFHRVTPRPELKENFPYMALYVGVMGRQDGADRVVRAAHHLVHVLGRKDVLFTMVGKGESWEEVRALAGELKVEDYMRFTGKIADANRLAEYLSTADVCLAPDPPVRMNHLSTMTKILEYMAFEQPIVAFHLLESSRSAGEAAVYVEEDDAGRFAQAIGDLLDDPARRARMGQIGRARTASVIGWNQARLNLLEGFSRLSGRKAGEAPAAPPEAGKAHSQAT